ncbi:3-phosphoshikimate 1-carboxyvinyltransferase [Mycoplasmatota bacterium]|nr:3-phosphoshikimate 1-carboxyvinyltransferase [Mycoplasmatota bacterium]
MMKLSGEVILPGDKSISHRALLLSAISYGKAKIKHLLKSEDVKATIGVLKALGVEIVEDNDCVYVTGRGFEGLNEPIEILNCMNSGTTARLLLGLLSGLEISSVLNGDDSLSKRPMRRVVKHLECLQANILLTDKNYLPAEIMPSKLKGNEVFLDVSSAQVKSAVLLAALKVKEPTVIHELSTSRNHTELMLQSMGADISANDLTIRLSGKNRLNAVDIIVPGDISSAAYFIVACLITPDSEILIKDCGLNPTRIGILKVLDQIGAYYKIMNQKVICNEIVGDLYLKYQSNLKPLKLEKNLIPYLIDEIPILTLLATQIYGTSVIKDARELRVKESDRIKSTKSSLTLLGADIIELEDGMIINGKTNLTPNTVDSYYDHRISMMLKVAKIICGNIKIKHDDCDKISYPNFENDLRKLLK